MNFLYWSEFRYEPIFLVNVKYMTMFKEVLIYILLKKVILRVIQVVQRVKYLSLKTPCYDLFCKMNVRLSAHLCMHQQMHVNETDCN